MGVNIAVDNSPRKTSFKARSGRRKIKNSGYNATLVDDKNTQWLPRYEELVMDREGDGSILYGEGSRFFGAFSSISIRVFMYRLQRGKKYLEKHLRSKVGENE